MNLLWLNADGLWPLNTRVRRRSFNMLAELSKRHGVTVVTTHGAGEDPGALKLGLPHCREVISIASGASGRGGAGFAAELLRTWVNSLPADAWRWHTHALRATMKRLLDRGDVDLCVADSPVSALNLPRRAPVPVVFFFHHVEPAGGDRLHPREKRAGNRLCLEDEAAKTRVREARFCRRSDLTVTISEIDRDRLRQSATGANIHAIPAGVDTGYFAPVPGAETPAELVFTGSMDRPLNEDAMFYFMERILPLIRRKSPGVTLTIAGRNPGPRLKEAAAREGVTLTGTVEDFRPYIARAAVYIAPLAPGDGVHHAIFEACAMGKAVVSTTAGAEGLPLLHERHFLRADGPERFAKSVIRLLEDPACRARLGSASRHLVLARHTWPQVAEAFLSRCEQLTRPLQEKCRQVPLTRVDGKVT